MADGQESNFNAGALGSVPKLKDPLEEEMATHSSGKSYYTEDLLPGKSHGERSLRGASGWTPEHGVNKESDITEQLTL